MLSTPIAYIIFNRPCQTRATFALIRAQQPVKLFLIADGPRLGHSTDDERCQEVRKIVEEIDWPCEVQHNYADQNIGCKQRVITGLNWVFESVEQAIILEDDVLPHPDFFFFCEELLSRYKNDDRVACITGDNFQNGHWRGDASYYFSKYSHIWGWATWRRSWMKNNPSLSFWPEWKKSLEWHKQMPDCLERGYWEQIMDKMYNNEIDTWDYPWTASIWYQGGLIATPNMNLVTNIGFGPDATHTVEVEAREGLPVHSLGALTHPDVVVQNKIADKYTFNYHCGGINFRFHTRLMRLPRLVVGKIYNKISMLYNS